MGGNLVLRQPIKDSQLLKCDQENREHFKYLRNVYCVMTNHSKDQDVNWPQTLYPEIPKPPKPPNPKP